VIYILNHYYRLNCLKSEIAAARKVLNEAWAQSGETTQTVLEAGDRFDRLINEYDKLVKETMDISPETSSMIARNKFTFVKQFAL
jgi:uncharacterized tellurite resistance protein B-like protein